ncbi:MAG: hypothetical protein K2H43_05820 [Clostridia bacterium]|nr:hypothetical protein [Clostridia bacterium]
MQSLRFGYDYTALDALFITHTHCDHFALDDLIQRFSCNSMNRMREVLQVFGNSEAVRRLEEAMPDAELKNSFSVRTLSNMQSASAGNYTITAFRSEHMDTEESLIYLFSGQGKNYLHVVDSAEPLDCVYGYLSEHKIKLDAVALDCTFALLKKEYFGHMNFTQNRRVKDRLTAIGAVREDTRFVLTHISHFAGNTHDRLEQEVRPYGFEVAYDGLLLTV